jgi:hypothetical protein
MSTHQIPVSGGCLCGAVRYESQEPPVLGCFCHCTRCRKNYGGFFQATVKFNGAGFRYTRGSPKYYKSSSVAKRGFCAHCGSPIVFLYEGNPDCWILVGSLDHPEDWPLSKDASWGPSNHWFIEDKIPWYQISDGLPQRSEPPAFIAARLQATRSNSE